MKIPLVDLQAQYGGIREDVLAAMTRVCDSQKFILGHEVEALERELAIMLGVVHAIGVSSGTDALLMAMMALDVAPGDEVITSPYTFFSTAGSIVRLGAKPVFVDIDPTTYNIDTNKITSVINRRTKAIVPVHLFGLSADLDPLLQVARSEAIPVIEDACQAIGARYKNRFVGALGAIGCFSFFPSKSLGGFGDGGLLVTNDDSLSNLSRQLRVHGNRDGHLHKVVGGNFRLDALQAAVLRVKATYLGEWCEGRRTHAKRYDRLFQEFGISTDIGDGGVTLPVEPSTCFHTYNQYVIRSVRRDELRANLKSCGVETAIYYPVPLSLQESFRGLGYVSGSFPFAELAARETLALPMYAEITEAQQVHVVKCIAEFLRVN